MNYGRFRDLAGRMFDEIPAPFQTGVAGLLVERTARAHPSIPGVYTLGECVTESWPDGLGGQGDTLSQIVLYHGSFQALATEEPHFDWEAELWETMLHELLHHREAAAGEDALDRLDWAVDQNYLRLSGRAFDPTFYHALPVDAEGGVRLEGETFLETRVASGETEAGFAWRGASYTVRVPASEASTWVRIRNLAGGRLWLIVLRRLSWWKRILRSGQWDPQFLDRRALPATNRDRERGR